MVLFQVESGWMVVNGRNLNGWTHHAPDLANSTTRCSARAPRVRPATGAMRSGPPGAASGTTVNSIDGAASAGLRAQPAIARHTISAAHERRAACCTGPRRRGSVINPVYVRTFDNVYHGETIHPVCLGGCR